MRSRKSANATAKTAAASLLAILFMGAFRIPSLCAIQTDGFASLQKTKRMAEAQHEIVVLLIKKRQYEEAAAEANKIFELKWTEDQEPLLVREMRNLTDQFLASGRASLGLQLVERNFGRFKRPSSRAALLKEMGYLHKKMNQPDKALDCFKKALNLEGGK